MVSQLGTSIVTVVSEAAWWCAASDHQGGPRGCVTRTALLDLDGHGMACTYSCSIHGRLPPETTLWVGLVRNVVEFDCDVERCDL